MDKEVFKVVRENGALPDPRDVDVSTIVEDLWEPYVDSATSLLSELEGAALALERGDNPEDDAAHIRRVLHTLKGEAGMTGFMDVHNLCHETETAFEELFEKGMAADLVLKVTDWMGAAIDQAQGKDREADREFDPEQAKKDKDLISTLIIEDDSICRKRLEMLLGDYCRCVFAANGKEGFDMYSESLQKGDRFDLITLDINMPEMDGHETLRAIRQLEEKHNIYGLDGVKVIMITSQVTSKHVFGAFREGCEAYVVKSYMGEKLLEEMAKLRLLKAKTLYSL